MHKKYMIVSGAFALLLIAAIVLVSSYQSKTLGPPLSAPGQYHLNVASGTYNGIINGWDSDTEDYTTYFFLPSYARQDGISFNYNEALYTFYLNDKVLPAKQALSHIIWDTPYTLTIVDTAGSTVNRRLIFMHSENLSAMYIKTETGSMDNIHANKSNTEHVETALINPDGSIECFDNASRLKGHGNQTWAPDKRPYLLKLGLKTDLLEMGSAKNWILMANAFDDTHIRNAIVYDFARNIGLAYTPEYRYIDLYLNGEYAGNYQLFEKIEIGENRINITDLEKENEALNPDIALKERTFGSKTASQKGILMDLEPPDISGGYLVERNYGYKYEDRPSGFITNQGDAFVIRSPAYASKRQVAYIQNTFQQLENAIFAEDGKDPESGRHYAELIDFESLVKKYLVEEIFKNEGGGATSAWFYKDTDSVNGLIYSGPVWDYDKSLGQDTQFKSPIGVTKLLGHSENTQWYAKLYEKEEFYTAAVQYYAAFLPLMQEILDTKIDAYDDEIRASVNMDEIRWYQLYDSQNRPCGTFDETAILLKDWITQRIGFLNRVWLNGEKWHMIKYTKGGKTRQLEFAQDGADGLYEDTVIIIPEE